MPGFPTSAWRGSGVRTMSTFARTSWGRHGRPSKSPIKTNPPRTPSAARLKQAIRPSMFYRRELPAMPQPKVPQGWVSGGLCVFHADRHVGNFRVNLGTGAYTCFACGARGSDIVAFTMARYDITFSEAARRLADAWGVRP